MLNSHNINYDRFIGRLFWLTLGIGVGGAIVAFLVWGRAVGCGFGLGSLASLLNLWLWHWLAATLTGKEGKPSKFATGLFAGRFLALFALGYVIVNYLDVSPLAAILGLFASAASATVEIIFELIAPKRLSL